MKRYIGRVTGHATENPDKAREKAIMVMRMVKLYALQKSIDRVMYHCRHWHVHQPLVGSPAVAETGHAATTVDLNAIQRVSTLDEVDALFGQAHDRGDEADSLSDDEDDMYGDFYRHHYYHPQSHTAVAKAKRILPDAYDRIQAQCTRLKSQLLMCGP